GASRAPRTPPGADRRSSPARPARPGNTARRSRRFARPRGARPAPRPRAPARPPAAPRSASWSPPRPGPACALRLPSPAAGPRRPAGAGALVAGSSHCPPPGVLLVLAEFAGHHQPPLFLVLGLDRRNDVRHADGAPVLGGGVCGGQGHVADVAAGQLELPG